MKGFILVNTYLKSREYLYQAERLKEEFFLRNVAVDILTNEDFLLFVENGKIVSELDGYDFCIYWDKDKYVLTMLEKTGMPTFDSKNAILNCDDKMLTYIELSDKGVPMPKTFPGLLCYNKDESVKSSTLDRAETLGYPLIVKESFGSCGQGVYLVENREQLIATAEKLKCKPHLFQEFISTSYGKDVRVIVIGGKVVGAMLRVGGSDFRSNIGSGGHGEPYELSKDAEALAVKIADILGLDYCGIDLLFGKDGFYVCEVNSNAFFFEFEKTTKINVAGLYADYILKKLKKNRTEQVVLNVE